MMDEILQLAKTYYSSKLRLPASEVNKNIGRIKRELDERSITELQNDLTLAKDPSNPKFGGGSNKASRRHGKRVKSRKSNSYKNKNKTKTRRYRKRSSTRRRK